MIVPAGELRDKVNFQVNTQSQSAVGDVTNSWATSFSTYAKIVSMKGLEYTNAQQYQSVVTHRIYVRDDTSVDNVTAAYRINHGSVNYNVEAVLRGNKNDWVTIMATEDVT